MLLEPTHRAVKDIRADVDAESARDGGAHGLGIELLALNFARFDRIVGESGELRLGAEIEADVGQPADEEPLSAGDRLEGAGELRELIAPIWPSCGLPDVRAFTAFHAAIMAAIHRIRNVGRAHACPYPFTLGRDLTQRIVNTVVLTIWPIRDMLLA